MENKLRLAEKKAQVAARKREKKQAELKAAQEQQAQFFAQLAEQFKDFIQTAQGTQEAIKGIEIDKKLQPLLQGLEQLRERMDKPVKVENPVVVEKVDLSKLKAPVVNTQSVKIPKWLEDNKTFTGIIKQLKDIDEKLKEKQKPEDFIPFRRVLKRGNTLVFDDSEWSGSPGGGGGGSGGGGATTIADGADIALGATTDAAVDTDTTGTVSGKLRGLVKLVVNLLTRWPASLGQKTKAGSLPVTLASDEDAVTVDATDLDIRNLSSASDSVTIVPSGTQTVSGSVTADTELPAAAALADTEANPTVPSVGAKPSVYNDLAGSWNRQKSIRHGMDTSGVGVAAAGIMGVLDDTATTTVTENQFAPVRITSDRELKVSETNSAAIKTAVETIDNAISGSEMQVDIVAALPAGTNNIGDVDVLTLPSIPAGTNNIGDVDIASIAAGDNNIGNVDIASIAAGDNNIGNVDLASAIPAGTNSIGKVVPEASASGTGQTTFRNAALSNTDVEVKASSGRVYWYNLFNPGTALAYVHFYDAATTDVTVGTTTPKLSIALPSNANAAIGLDRSFEIPISFATAITVAATTTPGGSTAPGTAIVANIGYV